MSNWTLTHVGEETSLATQETRFFLIFDHGKYRVPVTHEVLKTFLQQLANGVPASAAPVAEAADDEVVDESGVGQF